MLEITLTIITIIAGLGVLWGLLMLSRGRAVFNYRVKILERISAESKIDIEANRDYQWRYDVFKSVSFGSMVYKFWKPLDSFYADKSFIKQGDKSDQQ